MNSADESSHPVAVFVAGKREPEPELVSTKFYFDDVTRECFEVLGAVDLLVDVFVFFVVVVRIR